MTTQPFEKKKLTLNKRTIVLLNENDMKMMEGGVTIVGTATGTDKDKSKAPNDPRCDSALCGTADAVCRITFINC